MKVYVLIEKWACDYETGFNVDVYNDYGKAKIAMSNKIEEYKNNDMLFDVIENEKDYFTTYDDGYYMENHNTLMIQEKDVI